MRLLSVTIAGALALGCGPKKLPDRAPPAKTPIDVRPPTPTPPAGKARLYVDVTEGAARVGKVTEIKRTTLAVPTYNTVTVGNGVIIPVYSGTVDEDALERKVQPLCGTPCAIDLDPGDHLLEIAGGPEQVELVNVKVSTAVTTAYRHALGRSERPDPAKLLGPAALLGFGVGLVVTSPLMFLLNKPAGVISGVAGVAISIPAYFWVDSRRPRAQRGAGVMWELDER